MKIPYGRQSISEEDIRAVVEVLRSDWLTQGPKVREFEEALCDLTGAGHCVAVANGTVGLHLACLALDVGPGDVGITSPVSFMASANCIAYCGGTPAFADIDPNTLCLSPDEVEEACERGPVPRVVIPVDFAGVPADLPRFRELADRYGFSLIEDAAHAIGSTYTEGGRVYACGSCAHTDLAVFSFHPVKTVTTGEGGAVLTNDDRLAAKLRRLASHGIEKEPTEFLNPDQAFPGSGEDLGSFAEAGAWYHEMQELGLNARITDMQCALGLSQLGRLETFKARRQEIFHLYGRAFASLEEERLLSLPPWPEGTDPCYHLYSLRLGPRSALDRNTFFSALRKRSILPQVHYIPIYRQPYYRERFGCEPDRFPEAEQYYRTCLSLPLFPDLDEAAIRQVCDTVTELAGTVG